MANPRFHLRNETDRQRAIAILQRVDLTEGKTGAPRRSPQ